MKAFVLRFVLKQSLTSYISTSVVFVGIPTYSQLLQQYVPMNYIADFFQKVKYDENMATKSQ